MTTSKLPGSKDDSHLKRLIPKNPCGVCHALGLPECKGHASSDTQETGDPMDKQEHAAFLESNLSQNKNWRRQTETQDEDSIFNYFNPNALAAIKLDLSKGALTFFAASAYKSLLKAERDLVDGLFHAIEKTLLAFKNELTAAGEFTQSITMKREAGKLIISIPNPKHYDAFVQRLLDRNLLANRPELTPTKKKEEKSKVLINYQPAPEPEPTAPSPTPFHMKPRPKAWQKNN